ncbi:MAG: aspartate kinase, partial [Bdellovibrionales bacterium]|nr:aspartate kinase [Oligoflexia bacterium]
MSKFGGTSMGTVESMHQAARIVASKPAIRFVVVSATSGTTNQLIKIASLKEKGRDADLHAEISALKSRHREFAISLRCDEAQMAVLGALEVELVSCVFNLKIQDAQQIDELLSFGERFSSFLFTQALRLEIGSAVELLDARRYLRTDSQFGKAEPEAEQTKLICTELKIRLKQSSCVFVTQGFIGSDCHGKVTTLGRGGSDYSAALFAEALGADEVEIWTDVPGILTMDPRMVPTAQVISEISFAEAAEMA